MKRSAAIVLMFLPALLCGCMKTNITADPSVPAESATSIPSAVSTGTPAPTVQVTSVPSVSAPAETPSPDITRRPELTPSAPAVTPTPLPSYSQAPEQEAVISFCEDKYGMPSADLPAYSEIAFNLRGTVTADRPLASVTVTVRDKNGKTAKCTVSFSSTNIRSYRLDDKTATKEKTSPDNADLFRKGKPAVGQCSITVSARCIGQKRDTVLLNRAFKLLDSGRYNRLSPNNFRDGYYETALAFFGGEDFLFEFKNDRGRAIIQEKDWAKKNITGVQGPDGRKHYVNVKGAQQFAKAYEYMSASYVRVRSAEGAFDTGVVPVKALIAEFNGTYVSRFVSGKRFISHHAYGTAEDVNASYRANTNVLKNRDLIKEEVALLDYEGILQSDGQRYYSFVYRGSCTEMCAGIPNTLSNYIIYELSYFRAGFGWGCYYPHTSDAMHFTLSELPPSEHEPENGGLRKVYEYID